MGRTVVKKGKSGVLRHYTAVLQTPSFKSQLSQLAQKRNIQPLQVMDALMTDPDWPHYFDVFHPVRVLRYDIQRRSWWCRCPAFLEGENEFLFDSPLLVPRIHEKDISELKVGDLINFRLRKRTVNEIMLDGFFSEHGVWVRGLIMQITETGAYYIAHYDWSRDIQEDQKHIRPTFVKIAKSSGDLRPDPFGQSVPLSFALSLSSSSLSSSSLSREVHPNQMAPKQVAPKLDLRKKQFFDDFAKNSSFSVDQFLKKKLRPHAYNALMTCRANLGHGKRDQLLLFDCVLHQPSNFEITSYDACKDVCDFCGLLRTITYEMREKRSGISFLLGVHCCNLVEALMALAKELPDCNPYHEDQRKVDDLIDNIIAANQNKRVHYE